MCRWCMKNVAVLVIGLKKVNTGNEAEPIHMPHVLFPYLRSECLPTAFQPHTSPVPTFGFTTSSQPLLHNGS
jgi:hypothetical protein